MAPPIQRRKNPIFRKKKTSEEKKKMSLVVKDMEKKNFNEMLYSLPLNIKILIFQMAVYTHMVEWGEKEHKKNFKKYKMRKRKWPDKKSSKLQPPRK